MPLFGQHFLSAMLVQRGLIYPFVVFGVLPVVYWCVGMLICDEAVGVGSCGFFVVLCVNC